jgi:hypothetical protein
MYHASKICFKDFAISCLSHLFCLAAAADPSVDFDLQDKMDLLVLVGAGVWLDELMAAKTDFVLLDDMSSLK